MEKQPSEIEKRFEEAIDENLVTYHFNANEESINKVAKTCAAIHREEAIRLINWMLKNDCIPTLEKEKWVIGYDQEMYHTTAQLYDLFNQQDKQG